MRAGAEGARPGAAAVRRRGGRAVTPQAVPAAPAPPLPLPPRRGGQPAPRRSLRGGCCLSVGQPSPRGFRKRKMRSRRRRCPLLEGAWPWRGPGWVQCPPRPEEARAPVSHRPGERRLRAGPESDTPRLSGAGRAAWGTRLATQRCSRPWSRGSLFFLLEEKKAVTGVSSVRRPTPGAGGRGGASPAPSQAGRGAGLAPARAGGRPRLERGAEAKPKSASGRRRGVLQLCASAL